MLRTLVVAGCLSLALDVGRAQSNQQIYSDSLQNSWDDWSWSSTRDFASSFSHSGAKAIAVTMTGSYAGFSLHHNDFDSSPYATLSFWIHGGTSGGQLLKIYAELSGAAQPVTNLPPLTTTWQQFNIPLAALGVTNQPNFSRFWLQDRTGTILPTFYLDDIVLITNGLPPVTNTAVTIAVDAQLNRRAINPYIYGVAFASAAQLADLDASLNRSGGNAETRYNWLIDAHNRGADWYFESIGDSSGTPGASADSFISSTKSAGALPLITIPMIGWAPKLGTGRGKLSSFSIAKYGQQADHDWQYMTDAGNGIITNTSTPITTNNPTDANFATNSALQFAFVQHLTNAWGLSTNGGVRFYLMDNEHSIWHSTHRDVHPNGATRQEIRDKFFDYAGVVKSIDPNALVMAPEEFGWSGYFYSGADLQYGGQYGYGYLPDRSTNGGMDYVPWLLDQFHQRATNTNQRLLDYFTLHCYPEDRNVSGNDVSFSTQLLRNRQTREFWDTNYIDPTWINDVVKLIPRMKSWVATYYPGTKIGITEYNWGAEGHINGATAQADILGIFGREGLDLATRWGAPPSGSPTYQAMKMYRNYDGAKSAFGEQSVNAAVPNPDNVSAFAALRSSDNALTLMVINKQLSATATATVNLTNRIVNGTAQVWQLTASNVIMHLSDISFSGNVFTSTVPAQSITLFVLPSGAPPPPPHLRAGAFNPTNTFELWLDGTAGQRYSVLSSSNLLNWVPVQTNTLSSNSWRLLMSANGVSQRYFRGVWLP